MFMNWTFYHYEITVFIWQYSALDLLLSDIIIHTLGFFLSALAQYIFLNPMTFNIIE